MPDIRKLIVFSHAYLRINTRREVQIVCHGDSEKREVIFSWRHGIRKDFLEEVVFEVDLQRWIGFY